MNPLLKVELDAGSRILVLPVIVLQQRSRAIIKRLPDITLDSMRLAKTSVESTNRGSEQH
jgi:hypothetical protein